MGTGREVYPERQSKGGQFPLLIISHNLIIMAFLLNLTGFKNLSGLYVIMSNSDRFSIEILKYLMDFTQSIINIILA